MDEFVKVMAALTPVVLGVLTYYTAKANSAAKQSAQLATTAAEKVETTLAATTTTTAESLEHITNLVNGTLTKAQDQFTAATGEIVALKEELRLARIKAEGR